jgi:hypothetical protein
MSHPTVKYWEQVKRFLRYLKGTMDLCLTFNGEISTDMVMWQDSSYVDGENKRSMTSFIAMMCGGPIVWGIKLQPILALSTAKVEYMAVKSASHEVLFLRQLFANFDIMSKISTRMLEDNNGCMTLSMNATTPGNTKHIDIRHHFIRELVKSKVVVMEYCPTSEMIADALTKFTLSTILFLKHIKRMTSGTYSGPSPV